MHSRLGIAPRTKRRLKGAAGSGMAGERERGRREREDSFRAEGNG
jgi:hypothetical protein